MIQDESVPMPSRRTTNLDNAERVHNELLNQVTAARHALEQQQTNTSANIPTRRERMYSNC